MGREGREGGRHAIIVPALASSENSVLRIDRELQYSYDILAYCRIGLAPVVIW